MAEKKSFPLRVSPELWEAIARLAGEDFRSVNGQIEFILTEYARKRGALKREEPNEEQPGQTS